MDPIGELITTNEFWDVEGLDIEFTKNFMFQTLQIRMEVLYVKEEAIWKMQLQYLEANMKFWFTNHYIAICGLSLT
jgi:hypothetical protein